MLISETGASSVRHQFPRFHFVRFRQSCDFFFYHCLIQSVKGFPLWLCTNKLHHLPQHVKVSDLLCSCVCVHVCMCVGFHCLLNKYSYDALEADARQPRIPRSTAEGPCSSLSWLIWNWPMNQLNSFSRQQYKCLTVGKRIKHINCEFDIY